MPMNKNTDQISREGLWTFSKSQSKHRKEQRKLHKAPLHWILLMAWTHYKFFPVAVSDEKTEKKYLTSNIYKFAVEINRKYWWTDCSWPHCRFMVCIILHHHDTAAVCSVIRYGKNMTTAVFEDLIPVL